MSMPETTQELTPKQIRKLQKIRFMVHRGFPTGEGIDVRCKDCECYIARAVDAETAQSRMKEHEEYHASIPVVMPVQPPASVRKKLTPAVVGPPREYEVAHPDFVPGKGLAAELFNLMKKGPITAARATEVLLESGVYAKVAPRAAELRPQKPVEVLIGQWIAVGHVKER